MLKLLLISLMLPTFSFSNNICQDTLLTAQELKKLNLILIQHSKWESEVPVLYSQIGAYEGLVRADALIDSMKTKKLKELQLENQNNIKKIDKLKNGNKIRTGIEAVLAIVIIVLCL